MKHIERRLRRLEFRPQSVVNEHGQTRAQELRARRRRRLEAAGLPYDELPPTIFAGIRSIGELIRNARYGARRRAAQTLASGGAR
jgi:hypothetical protein